MKKLNSKHLKKDKKSMDYIAGEAKDISKEVKKMRSLDKKAKSKAKMKGC